MARTFAVVRAGCARRAPAPAVFLRVLAFDRAAMTLTPHARDGTARACRAFVALPKSPAAKRALTGPDLPWLLPRVAEAASCRPAERARGSHELPVRAFQRIPGDGLADGRSHRRPLRHRRVLHQRLSGAAADDHLRLSLPRLVLAARPARIYTA